MAIQFQLIKIDVPQFAIIPDKPVMGPFRVDYNVSFHISKEQVVRCSQTITYYKDDELITKLVTESFFRISETSWKEQTHDNMITLPAGFLQHIAVISLGTARGIQYAKTESANINNYLIPLINLTEIIKDDMTVIIPK